MDCISQIANEITSVQVSLASSKPVVFRRINPKEKYFVKCSVNNVKSTYDHIELINRYYPNRYYYSPECSLQAFHLHHHHYRHHFDSDSHHYRTPPVVIEVDCNLEIIIHRYQHKKQTLYDFDDIEKIGLLKRKSNSFVFTRPSPQCDLSDNEYLLHTDGIQCTSCMDDLCRW